MRPAIDIITINTHAQTATRLDIVERVRELTNSASPIAQVLSDPVTREGLVQSTKRSKKTTHGEHHRSRALFGQALAEEAHHVRNLEDTLRQTADYLVSESRRADEEASRARFADMRASEAEFRASTAENAQRTVELDSADLRNDIQRYRLQFESTRRDLTRLERRNEELEANAEKARDSIQDLQLALARREGLEMGKEEGWTMAMQKQSDESREVGWAAGMDEGFEDGRSKGFAEGWKKGIDEGYKQGRSDERWNAINAFDRYIDDHGGGSDETVSGLYLEMCTDNLRLIIAKEDKAKMGRIDLSSR